MDAGRVLRYARRRAGLTQRALAQRAGIPQPTIARIESRAMVPRVDTLDRLLESCGLGLEIETRPGQGVDRTLAAELLRMSVQGRISAAEREADEVDRLLAATERLRR